MTSSVCVDLHLFLLAEGRHDILSARPSIRTVALAGAVWDMLAAGLLWGVPGKSFTAAKPLPPELDMLEAAYDIIARRHATRPGALWQAFFAADDTPADKLSQAVVDHLAESGVLNKDTLEVAPVARADMIKRVRHAALGPTPSPNDAALLLALDRSTFLRDAYFRGRSEKLHLSNRLRSLESSPPLAGGWSMQQILKQFFLYDQCRSR